MGSPSRQPTIGIISRYMSGPFFGATIAGVLRRAAQLGVRPILLEMLPSDVLETRLCLQQVDGFLAILFEQGAKHLSDTGTPVVMISNHVDGLSSVLIDNASGIARHVEHLLALGHRRIAFAAWFGQSDTHERLAAYRATLERHAIAFDERLVFSVADSNLPGGREAARQMLDAGIDFTAIVAATDFNALGIMEGLTAAGYRFPEDLAITGFDDIAEAQTSVPPLTTERLQFADMGAAALDLLLRTISMPATPLETIRFATIPIIRRSCGTPDRSDMIAVAASTGADWHAQLLYQLTQAVIAPSPMPGDVDPSAIWPGAATLVAALDAALSGAEQPDRTTLQRAWDEAANIAVYSDTYARQIDMIAATGMAQLAATGPEDPRRARMTRLIERLHVELLAVWVGRNSAQRANLERQTDLIARTSAVLTASDMAATLQLRWAATAEIAWAYFGRWSADVGGRILGSGTDAIEPSEHASLAVEQFPGAAISWEAGRSLTVVVRVQTERRDWGVLAMQLPYDSHDGLDVRATLLASMHGARLDQLDLLAELDREQQAMRASYERERALADTVRALGCPIIQLRRGALLVPLIGAIDNRRAQQLSEIVLAAVVRQGTRDVLLDVSGVPVIDTHVAGALIQLAQMIGLVGARTSLIGVRPEIAQSIVSLGVDLRTLSAYASLEDALRTTR
jgi:anti-anti-sigma factor